MKTTDSVMREKLLQDFDTHMTREWKKHVDKFPESNNSQFESGFDVAQDIAEKFYSHSLAEVRREVIDKVEQLKWEPKGCDETYWYTRGDDVIRSQVYFEAIKDVLYLLTGDNPERKV